MAAETAKSQTNEAPSDPDGGVAEVAIAGKVPLPVWQKLKYLSLKRSMATGQNVTLSRTIGDILVKSAEGLEDPPSELIGS